jgi:ATP synthase D chain, mitochondrial (ATP5H)
MLSRSVLRFARSRAHAARNAPSVSRALSADASASLTVPEKKSVSVEDYQRFDPSNWLAGEGAPQVRAELARIRQAEDDAIAAVTEDVPEIDWDVWRKEISYPGLVDELKAAHDSVKVPSVEEERLRLQAEVTAAFEPLLAKLKQHAIDAENNSTKYKRRLEEITYLHDNVASMPIDEFLEKYPAVKKSIEDDIKNNKWFV